MIRIESIRIQEFRGIRDLTLNVGGGNYVVYGPNGSGKSGVVDAIQFALTGEIRRLRGPGTGDLTLGEHGPHVDHRKEPAASAVELAAFIPRLKTKAVIRRTIAKAKQPEISPDDEAVRGVFSELAKHPEITLARREIITLILTEATKRSRDVQTLLQLDRIDVVRAALKTTENRLGEALTAAEGHVESASYAVRRHLALPSVTAAGVLNAVNSRRKTLGLSEITALTKDSRVSEGITTAMMGSATAGQGRESALADLRALEDAVRRLEPETGAAIASVLKQVRRLQNEPDLLVAIKRQALVRSGLALVDGPSCPLCDVEWDVDKLRAHLAGKLSRATEALEVEEGLRAAGRAIAAAVQRLRSLLEPVSKLPEVERDAAMRLADCSRDLGGIAESLRTVEGAVALKERLEAGWGNTRVRLQDDVRDALKRVEARPAAAAAAEATAFLAVAEERLSDLRHAKRQAAQAAAHAERARIAYRTYNDVSEAQLLKLYGQVEGDLCSYYRAINEDDERDFTAKFSPSRGKLGFAVDFHRRGRFPPAAYHSEGHQDGMGVCLYLALLKRVLGERFTLGVLDDVVMSVDSQHRRRFCKLLKTEFPDTQFVITTHDEVWARQMRSEGLVDQKSTMAFNSWSVEAGPIIAGVKEVWDSIESDLKSNDVANAAGRLRRHLEYVARELAHGLIAPVPFRADGAYDLGHLLHAVVGRHGNLLKDAAKAAASWGQKDVSERVRALQESRAAILKALGAEEWAINKLVHYNEWATLTAGEFRMVTTAYRELLAQLRCSKCDSWLVVTPPIDPTDLRCDCAEFRLNLKGK